MEQQLWTPGRYDLVAFIEMPSDKAFATVGLRIGMTGAIRTERLRALTADEMMGILR
jgi:uncharacterized protein with GYD domain